MKILKNKIIACLIIMLVLLSIIQLPIMAKTGDNVIVLQKAEKDFIIYDEENCNNEFEFAFSKTDSKDEESKLNFTASGKDQKNSDALNIAYVNEELYDEFFLQNNNKAYIWIMNSNDEVTVKLIDLNEALDEEKIELVNTTTARIAVDTNQTYETNKMIDGVDTTVRVGKIVIEEVEGKEDAKYSYQLFKADEGNYNEFFNLAYEMKNGINGTYNQLEAIKEFYDLYTTLKPEDNNDNSWETVENRTILQPESKQDDKYVVWIKEETDAETIVDAKFLISSYEYTDRTAPEKIVIKETVKLPVTYDSIVLFVILGILVIAIIIVAILKIKSNSKGKHN